MTGARIWPVLLMWLTVVVTLGCEVTALTTVQSIDAEVRVRMDGAVDVREVLTVTTPYGGVASVVRHVARERAEALRFLSASIDGRHLEPGLEGATSLIVGTRNGLEVTWRFPSAARTTRVLELNYRADGAVAVRGSRGTLRHVVVPGARRYDIGAAKVRLVVPDGLPVFDGTGIAEAGWTVSRTPTGILAERQGLGADDSTTVVAEIGIDPAEIAEPSWQRHDEWARQLIPAFVSGGLFILVIGVGVLWILRFQYPAQRAESLVRADDEDERRAVRAGLWTSGLVSVALASVLAGVTWLTLSHFGIWPQAVPVSIFIVGLVFLAVSRRFV